MSLVVLVRVVSWVISGLFLVLVIDRSRRVRFVLDVILFVGFLF